ncbi:MAG: metallophosphoesterase [Oscillospiraceae bacterium]
MIYVTGDTHGDLTRFRKFRRLFGKKRDICIVCGDFGFVWNGSAHEKSILTRMSRLDCTILFVEGTHDNLDLLADYPEEDFCGGRAHRVEKNILWLRRGDVFTLEGKTVLALGGSESPDADEREPHITWWPQEQPSVEDLQRAFANLAAHDNQVDLIITHQHPRIELGLIDCRDERISALTAFLGDVNRTVRYGHWYFGCDHLDRSISRRMTAIFEQVVAVGDPCSPANALPTLNSFSIAK